MKSNFNNNDVEMVSLYIQYIMKKYQWSSLTADQCAELLNSSKILLNDVGPKPGFNFRQMLRDGRDGKINLVKGATQDRPGSRWLIIQLS